VFCRHPQARDFFRKPWHLKFSSKNLKWSEAIALLGWEWGRKQKGQGRVRRRGGLTSAPKRSKISSRNQRRTLFLVALSKPFPVIPSIMKTSPKVISLSGSLFWACFLFIVPIGLYLTFVFFITGFDVSGHF